MIYNIIYILLENHNYYSDDLILSLCVHYKLFYENIFDKNVLFNI